MKTSQKKVKVSASPSLPMSILPDQFFKATPIQKNSKCLLQLEIKAKNSNEWYEWWI